VELARRALRNGGGLAALRTDHVIPARLGDLDFAVRREPGAQALEERGLCEAPSSCLLSTLRDVESIELVYALYERNANAAAAALPAPARFVSLFVREAASTDLISNCNTVRNAFTQLPMLRDVNEYTPQKSFRSIHVYPGSPLAKLDRLTIAFAAPDGTSYPMRDHLLRFEITTVPGGSRTP
jgi:hypothetical protein